MRTGIGLPAAVPDTDMSGIGDWAAEAERAGLASVVRLSGGRLTAGLGMEGWPADYGWVAPLFGHAVLADGAEALAGAWRDCDRGDSPRIVTGRYFSLGADAEHVADEYIRPYYGADYYALARADTLTEPDQIGAELDRLEQAGCDDVLLFPCSGDPEQVSLLAAAREFAGDRLVDVAAGQIGSQALELGLIDEVVINQVPVVFGAGRTVLRHRRAGRAAEARESDHDRARRPGHPPRLRRPLTARARLRRQLPVGQARSNGRRNGGGS